MDITEFVEGDRVIVFTADGGKRLKGKVSKVLPDKLILHLEDPVPHTMIVTANVSVVVQKQT